MLRAIVLGVALSALAAACALATPPPPAGTVMVQAQVRNGTSGQVELTVTTLDGVLPGAVQPASLATGSTTLVTFYVPPGSWMIAINGTDTIPAVEAKRYIRRMGCLFQIELAADGSTGWGCLGS